MTTNMILIVIGSSLIWIALINELNKPSKKHNNRKIMTLLSFGTLSTVIITVSLFKRLFV